VNDMDVTPIPKPKRYVSIEDLLEYKRTHRSCEYCGGDWHLQVHHIKSRGSGGGDTVDNLMVLCTTCHNKAHGVPGFNRKLKQLKERKRGH
jgi:5-methylcytosine-specific restriction endonuclease McrA